MKIAELIALLNMYPQDTKVFVRDGDESLVRLTNVKYGAFRDTMEAVIVMGK